MRQNPVYSREMKVSARSPRFPLILSLFNGILCLAALINMYSVVLRVRTNATIQYSSFMDIYEFVTAIEFILLMFIVPAVTAASISGERERQTLDLMLTTQMTAAQIVTGKLMGALSSLFVLILSSFPAVAMVFVYGGITWWDALSLIFCYVAVAFMAGSLGIFFSSVFRRSTVSTAVTYGTLIAFVAGTYFINRFALSMSAANLDQTIAAYAMEALAIRASSGGAFYLFLMNPAFTFMAVIGNQAGRSTSFASVCSYFGMENTGFVMEHWVLLSVLLQLAAGALLLWEAVQFLEPVKKKGKRKNKRMRHTF